LSISGRIGGTVAVAANRFAAALLPQDCFLCGQAENREPLCPSCRNALPRLAGSLCPVCAAPTPDGNTCGACLKDPPRFDATISIFRYAFPVDKLIQALKYQHRLALAKMFADVLLAGPVPNAAAIVPLPLSLQRLRQRGFNQAVEIARPLARRLGLPLLLDVCCRPLEAPAQASLPWQARRKNVRGAFACAGDLAGMSIAVVDDVMTTGATLDEFAHTLKRHGAGRVTNWVVARTLKD
jgi:ComF family protein